MCELMLHFDILSTLVWAKWQWVVIPEILIKQRHYKVVCDFYYVAYNIINGEVISIY